MVIGNNVTAVLDNSVLLGNAGTTIFHPADDNGVDLGSTSYSFKDAYIQGNLKIGYTSGSTYFQLPTTTGTSGQVLKVPSSGNTLEWGSAGAGVDFVQTGNDLLVGHSTAPVSSDGYNVALGDTALNSLNGGQENIAIGYNAGTSITSGNYNVTIGNNAGDSITTASNNIAIGANALASEDNGGSSIAIGSGALQSQNGGLTNTAVGHTALYAVVSGDYNVGIGWNAGQYLINANKCTAIGTATLQAEQTGDNITAVGYIALYSQDGAERNKALGSQAGAAVTTGSDNTFIGYEAGNSTTSAGRNVAIGSYALENSQTSERNVAIGYEALEGSTTADYSVALGYRAGSSNSGNYNTFVGYEAGDDGNITGVGLTLIGANSSLVQGASSDNYAVAIGYNSSTRGSNTVTIGAAKPTIGIDVGTTDARIYGLRTAVTAVTGDPTLTANDSGETFVFNDAASTFTLPDSGGGDMTGVYFHFIVLDDTAGTKRIQCADSTNEDLIGGVRVIDVDDDSTVSFAAQVSDEFHQITFDGTTTGRGGSKVTVTNIAADKWHVEGTLLCSGTPATPFS